jgi:hypothetical protein
MVAMEYLVSDTSILNSLTAVNHPFPWEDHCAPPIVPLLKTKVRKYELSVNLLSLLDIRTCEGFQLESIEKHDSNGDFGMKF